MDYPGAIPNGREKSCGDSPNSPREVLRSPSPEKALLAWRAVFASLAELAVFGKLWPNIQTNC